ncbi:hypothetical protein CR513_40346, partial [Mucuna pruriens]
MQQLAKGIPLLFPNRTASARRSKIDEDLLKLFMKVENNIPLLDAIKQVSKYAKFFKELCVHNRKKMKGAVKTKGVVSVSCTFTDAMLDLRASIKIILASIYRRLNLGDLEPTWMVIQLANKSVVQPLGILKDVLVQVNELIFPVDFYVLDMEDKAF